MPQRRSHHTPNVQNRWRLYTKIVAALLLAFFTVGRDGMATEGGNIQTTNIEYQTGTIRAIYERTFQIDEKAYGLTPDAVIVDDRGHPTDAGAMAVGIEVKYHVKKDKGELIDNMILFLPR